MAEKQVLLLPSRQDNYVKQRKAMAVGHWVVNVLQCVTT